MPDKVRKQMRRQNSGGGWRYLTFSCHHRLGLLGNPSIRELMASSIAAARERCGFRLRAWVIMPEHVHIILAPTTRDWLVPKILVAVKQPVAQTVIHRWKMLNAPILTRLTLEDGRARF